MAARAPARAALRQAAASGLSGACASAAASTSRASLRPALLASGRRDFGSSSARHAISKFAMPAMSPTMTEGGIANWKVKEGDAFSAGDVLLEIETDKATMDVEAQEDGVLGKIIVQNGAKDVKVGRTIALLAEEGDDISNLEVPAEEASAPASSSSSAAKEESAPVPKQERDSASGSSGASTTASGSSSSSAPAQSSAPHGSHGSGAGAHGGRVFPSVARLLAENHVSAESAAQIKGTGVRGMLTKGDVLAFLGQAPGPMGTFKPPAPGIVALSGGAGAAAGQKDGKPAAGAAGAKTDTKPLDEAALRSLIIGGLASASYAARAKPQPVAAPAPLTAPKKNASAAGLDAILSSYTFASSRKAAPASQPQQAGKANPFKGLL